MSRSLPPPGLGGQSRGSQLKPQRSLPPPLSLPTSESTAELLRGDQHQSQLELQSQPELQSQQELPSGSLPDQPRPDLLTLMLSWMASPSTVPPSSLSRTQLMPTPTPSPAQSPSTRTAAPSRQLSSRTSRAEFSSTSRTARPLPGPAQPQW